MIRRRAALAAVLVAATVAIAGCGGGGGNGGDAGDDPTAAVPPAQGVAAGDSSGQAVASLGASAAAAPSEGAGTLESYEAFGTPKDHFEQQVTDGEGDGGVGEPGTGGAPSDPGGVVPSVPDVADATPLVAVPASGEPVPDPGAVGIPPAAAQPGDGASGEPGGPTDAPPEPARAMEADFDISGEPVVAREGDSIPPDTQQFVIEAVGAREVQLKLNGGLLPDGTDTVTLAEGESVTLYNATAKRSYRVKLVDLRPARG